LVNVRVRERANLSTIPDVAAAMARVEDRLGDNGRLLVRYSGTEPLLRVMLEGQNKDEIDRWAHEIVDAVSQAIGQRQ
jgi:phosphoglucosamine mutase